MATEASKSAVASEKAAHINDAAASKSGASTSEIMLHGTLKVIVHEAKNLENSKFISDAMDKCWACCTYPARRKGRLIPGVTSDPYVCVSLGAATVARTKVMTDNRDPKFEEAFTILTSHPVGFVDFVIKDANVVGADVMGRCRLPAGQVSSGQPLSQWYHLHPEDDSQGESKGELRVSVHFTPSEAEAAEVLGSGFEGVKAAYFPMRRGGRVHLYQDTCVWDHFNPGIELEGGVAYQPAQCWRDICQTILEARRVIYITGWSVFCNVTLSREGGGAYTDVPLGEVLKEKARSGVKVLLLVWDDVTSINSNFVKNKGVMQTHDEDTRKFFRGTGVHCLMAPRTPAQNSSLFRKGIVSTFYTHHQKVVIADAPPQAGGDGQRRRLVGYLGGIDLCGGRYDTQEHSLYRTGLTIHKDDWQQHNMNASRESGCPRQPWHDLHSKVEGPSVWDLVTNFEQRWRAVCGTKHQSLKLEVQGLRRDAGIEQAEEEGVGEEGGAGEDKWHTQIFRSIDSGSVNGYPADPNSENLESDKGYPREQGILAAYIRAIRRAQHFIYIENQYFLGASYAWADHRTAGAFQSIPMELALKVASKIRAGENFRVYITVPMWPEGVPAGAAVQAILCWQTLTLQMMYKLVAEAIRDAKLEGAHPRDFLSFFCLGNRETRGEVPEVEVTQPPEEGTPEARASASRRQMVYVHSKMMVVDDEYVIIGSANINQRSMDGQRDTEIAMGAFQPKHTWAERRGQPKGQVYGFRMALWAEHMGGLVPNHSAPSSLQCMRAVNKAADANWKQYVAPEVTDMKAHLVAYPLLVGEDGSVGPIPEFEEFPDVGGLVVGKPQRLPEALTT